MAEANMAANTIESTRRSAVTMPTIVDPSQKLLSIQLPQILGNIILSPPKIKTAILYLLECIYWVVVLHVKPWYTHTRELNVAPGGLMGAIWMGGRLLVRDFLVSFHSFFFITWVNTSCGALKRTLHWIHTKITVIDFQKMSSWFGWTIRVSCITVILYYSLNGDERARVWNFTNGKVWKTSFNLTDFFVFFSFGFTECWIEHSRLLFILCVS